MLTKYRPLFLLVLGWVAFLTAIADDVQEEARIFVYESDVPGAAVWIPESYGITIDHHTPASLTEEWAGRALAAPLWMLGRSDILRRPETMDTLARLFADGGSLYIHHNALPLAERERIVLEQLGVHVPEREEPPARYHVVVQSDAQHALVRTPHVLEDIDVRRMPPLAGFAYFTLDKAAIAAGVQPLMHDRDYEDRVAMTVQDKVQGAGRVLFGAMPVLNLRPRVYNFDRFINDRWNENLLTLAFGPVTLQAREESEEESEEEQTLFAYPALDIGTARVRDINPWYLRAAGDIPWWDARWARRLPVLVFEPLGVARAGLPVTVALDADLAAAGSVRVVTPWGEEVPAQVFTREQQATVTFAADFLAHEHRLFFVYMDGPQAERQTASSTGLEVLENGDHLVLQNHHLRAVLRRDVPRLVYLAPHANPTGNQLCDHHGLWPEGVPGSRLTVAGREPRGLHAVVVEQGPVRAVIEYQDAKGVSHIRVILHAGSRYLEWSALPGLMANDTLRRETAWSPGLGMDGSPVRDILRYADGDRVRRIPIDRVGLLVERGGTEHGVGWYALEEARSGQVVGELFATDAAPVLAARFIHMHLTIAAAWQGSGREIRGAWMPLPEGSGYLPLRRAAVHFNHPAQVLMSHPQTREHVTATVSVPQMNRQFIRGFLVPGLQRRGYSLPLYISGDRALAGGDDAQQPWSNLPHVMEWIRRHAGNYISVAPNRFFWESPWSSPPDSDYMDHLLRAAHPLGIGVRVRLSGLLHRGKTSGQSIFFGEDAPEGFNELEFRDADKIQFRDLAAEAARTLAAYPIDSCMLQEESVYVIANPFDPSGQVRSYGRQRFIEQYGMEPAMPVRVHELQDPRHHKTVFFQMEAYTALIEAMAEAMREENPGIDLSTTDAPSTMSRIHSGGPHDWERHSDFLDMQVMDNWGLPRPLYKWYRKLMRAQFDNRGSTGLLSMVDLHGRGISGEVNLPARMLGYAHDHEMMWGLQAIWVFPPLSSGTHNAYYAAAGQNFRFYQYTGLGDLIARARPYKRVALLRDRAGMLSDIRQGRWITEGDFIGCAYDTRLQNVVYLPHFQCDLVMSKYFSIENLREYPVLYLASYDALEDDFVDVIAAYLEQGGQVLAEGDVLGNARLQALAGVRLEGVAQDFELAVMDPEPFAFAGRMTQAAGSGARVRIAASDGTPVVYERAVGPGRLLYTPLWLSEQVHRPEIGSFFRSLVDDLAGAFKVRLEGEEAGLLDSSLLQVEGLYILGVHNPEERDINVTLHWAAAPVPPLLADFSRGPLVEFGGRAPLAIPGRSVIFYVLGDREGLRLPGE